MKISCIVVVTYLILAGCTRATTNPSKDADISSFIKNADICIHLSGEWDSELPKFRRAEIENQVDKYCGEAEKLRKKIRLKYKNDTDVDKVLNSHDFEFD